MGELSCLLLAAAGQWPLGALLRASVQGGAALAMVWLICGALPKFPPVWKCRLLRLAYVKLLVAFCWLTPIPLAVLRTEVAGDPVSTSVAADPAGTASASPVPPQMTAESRMPLDVWLLGLWLAGAGTCVVVVATRWGGATRLRRSCVAVDDPLLLRTYGQLAAALGVWGPPPLAKSGLADGPLLVGVVRPVVVLPLRLAAGNPDRVRLMLAHELAHHRRHDLQWGVLPLVVRVLFWFHPIVWLAERELWLARESACDAMALRATGASPAEYGWTLLDAAVGATSARAPSRFAAAGVIGSKSTLKRRISAMQFLPGPLRRRWTALAAAAAVALSLSLVPVRLTAQPATRPGRAAASTAPSDGSASTGEGTAPDARGTGARLTLPGNVEARTAELRPAMDGVVSQVKCDLGQAVKRGDLLIELDGTVARAELEAAEAHYQVARANAQQWENAPKGAASEQEARAKAAERQAAAAEVDIRQAALNQTRILAPFDGIIARRGTNAGDVVKRGDSLATLVQLDPLGVSVDVPQSELWKLHVGEAARVRGSVLGGRVIGGKVTFISPQVHPTLRTGIVKLAVNNVDGELKPGMSVEVEFFVSLEASKPAKK